MPKRHSIDVPGLEQPAEIRVDRWGISHIRAATRRDVFFVQGFNAARDRLWQLDIWRKRGLGRMAADFGPGFLAQDRAARLFLYRGDMEAEWAAYGTPEARAIVTAFVAGINAWIARTVTDPGLLPPEFDAMRTAPELWAPEDVVRIRSHGLTRNALSEAARAKIMTNAGAETDLARRSLEPPHTPIVPEGFDSASVSPDMLDVFRLATASPDFSPERLAAALDDAWRWTKVTDQGTVELDGSNNWAVAPTRSETGRPILASDPHRAHALPSLRSIVHLSAPGIDVIGATEPALPGVSIGHNGTAAFSLTILPMDQEDLYLYEINPANPHQYRYRETWESLQVVEEQVEIRGHPPQSVTLLFTRHGPVVWQGERTALVVRSIWSEPGSAAYLGSLAYIGAKNVADFASALAHWSAPSVNQVYADTAGHIAWFAAGRAPVRPNWDGLLPVPGDGSHEWAGFVPFSELPRAVDPQRGFIATANEMNLPAGYPATAAPLGYEWSERSRSIRIHEVLASQGRHSLEQSQTLQTDTLSVPARRLTALIRNLPGPAAKMLLNWDHRLDRNSAAAALFEVWWTCHLKPALLDRIAPDADTRALLVPGDTETLLALLEQTDSSQTDLSQTGPSQTGPSQTDPNLPRHQPEHQTLLADTLTIAHADCASRMGADTADWAWGRLHHGAFPHPLSRVADLPGVGRLPKGGSGSTVMAAGYRLSDFCVTHGASFRMVLDVGNWDASVCINAPGQSGDPRSPHYADLAPIWAAGGYVPLLYSQAAVDDATEEVISLQPGVLGVPRNP